MDKKSLIYILIAFAILIAGKIPQNGINGIHMLLFLLLVVVGVDYFNETKNDK